MKSDLIELAMAFHGESAKAVKVSDDGNSLHAIWLPKSLIEFEQTEPGMVLVTIPEWLAIEKGLV
ncbi:hypothetical protein [Rhodoblastus sp.]|uniref:hypothetical protein n=1 Tax=Rhodoblastus sp. TaxID=1962975 RepID=UPI003F96BD2A